jgi:RNA ligase
VTFDRRQINLKALNSLTKYPSIPTYHQLGPGGVLAEPAVEFPGTVIGTEKVDGTNARIILLPDGGYLLGSREELLHAEGDLIANPALGIVEHLQPVVGQINPLHASVNAAVVLYLELYGGKIGGQAKNYSTKGAVGWRLFDVAYIDQLDERLTWAAERISGWRDNGGQAFAGEDELNDEAKRTGLELTPRLFVANGFDLPDTIEGMHAVLRERLPSTLVGLDDSAKGQPEGIVLRAADRSVIAKARFQDYERTARRQRPS